MLLDLTGGVLSLFQLVGDCAAMSDWTGITGNPAKIALSLVTILFDASFRYCDIFTLHLSSWHEILSDPFLSSVLLSCSLFLSYSIIFYILTSREAVPIRLCHLLNLWISVACVKMLYLFSRDDRQSDHLY